LTHTFSKRKGLVVALKDFGGEKLFLEILDATDDKFICLFGVR